MIPDRSAVRWGVATGFGFLIDVTVILRERGREGLGLGGHNVTAKKGERTGRGDAGQDWPSPEKSGALEAGPLEAGPPTLSH